MSATLPAADANWRARVTRPVQWQTLLPGLAALAAFGLALSGSSARLALLLALGGLLMGYGARIAYGCNIGAFFSGVASTSLHGWLWIAAALPGNWLGARMRPAFGMSL